MIAILLVLLVMALTGCAHQKVVLNLETGSGSAITNIALPGVIVRANGGNATASKDNVVVLPVYSNPLTVTTNAVNATATINFSPKITVTGSGSPGGGSTPGPCPPCVTNCPTGFWETAKEALTTLSAGLDAWLKIVGKDGVIVQTRDRLKEARQKLDASKTEAEKQAALKEAEGALKKIKEASIPFKPSPGVDCWIIMIVGVVVWVGVVVVVVAVAAAFKKIVIKSTPDITGMQGEMAILKEKIIDPSTGLAKKIDDLQKDITDIKGKVVTNPTTTDLEKKMDRLQGDVTTILDRGPDSAISELTAQLNDSQNALAYIKRKLEASPTVADVETKMDALQKDLKTGLDGLQATITQILKAEEASSSAIDGVKTSSDAMQKAWEVFSEKRSTLTSAVLSKELKKLRDEIKEETSEGVTVPLRQLILELEEKVIDLDRKLTLFEKSFYPMHFGPSSRGSLVMSVRPGQNVQSLRTH